MTKDVEKTWKKSMKCQNKLWSIKLVTHKIGWKCLLLDMCHQLMITSFNLSSILTDLLPLCTRYKPAKLRPHSASHPHGILIPLATNTLIAKDDEGRGTRNEERGRKEYNFSKDAQTWKKGLSVWFIVICGTRFLRFGTIRRHAKSLRTEKKKHEKSRWVKINACRLKSALPLKAQNWATKSSRRLHAPCVAVLPGLLAYIAYSVTGDPNPSIPSACAMLRISMLLGGVRSFDFKLKTQSTALKENLMMVIFASWKRVDRWLGVPSSMAMLNDKSLWIFCFDSWHPQSLSCQSCDWSYWCWR